MTAESRIQLIDGTLIACAGVLILLGSVVSDWFELLVGVALLLLAVVDALRMRRETAGFGIWARTITFGAAGAALIVFNPETTNSAGIVVGAVLGVVGIVSLWRALRAPVSRSENVVAALVAFALAALVLLFPATSLRAVSATIGVAMFGIGFAVIAMTLGSRIGEDERPWQAFVRWIRERQYSPKERRELVDTLYFVGDDAAARLTRFTVLLVLAAIIATFGVAADNVAVVVGAMLISPITAPIMGMSAGILLGFRRRTLLALLTLLGSGVGVVALAALIGAIIPEFALERNNLVSTFASPTLIDLAVALAAGAAGGFATARRDVSNSLPGVAVSLTLVPALATAGLLFQAGALVFGVGALLTFVTNAVAIVLAAAVAFVLTGFAPLRRIEESGQSVRFGLGIAILVVVLVTIPLAWSVEQIIDRSDFTTGVEVATREWLGDDSGYEVLDVSLLTDAVEVRLAGTGDLPDVNKLSAEVDEAAGRHVELVVKVIEQRTLVPGKSEEAAGGSAEDD
jgi:uncharacterized hydrophobic protein (TIGR00271 family)